jgi:predicted phage baseplate assembly protein
MVQVRARTQLSAEAADGGAPLIFETTRALIAFRAQLTSLLRSDPDTGIQELIGQNAQGAQPFEPFGHRTPDDAFLALGFEDPADLPGETLDLAVVAAGGPQGPAALTCSGSLSASYSPATLVWEYHDGAQWQSLTLLKDETLSFTRTGHVQVKLPAKGIPLAARTNLIVTDPTLRFWIRARVTKSQYEKPPRLLAIRTNTVPVEQAETVRDEVVGGSDGSRNQRFRLANRPVLAESLKLEIQVSTDGPEPWTETDDLFRAGPRDNVYSLNRTMAEVLTGDGVHGNVPVAFADDPGGNVVAREYRFGGGRRGNVAAGAISTLVTAVDGIDQAGVRNFEPAHSGRDEEGLEEAKRRAPSTLRSRSRAVTANDFEYLAEQAGSIKRAKALPGFHPDFPRLRLPGVVSVIVVPDADPDNPRPMPSDGTLRAVCAYLDARRLLTTEVLVLRPTYQEVTVIAEIVALDTADPTRVHDGIVAALVDYFHPLRGGDNKAGWPFGGTIYYSRVYQRVFAVPGVASIEQLTLVVDGVEQERCTDVPIAPNGLLSSGDHTVRVHYAALEPA